MTIDKPLLKRIVYLANLELPQQAETAILEELNNIFTWIEKVHMLPTDSVQPIETMSPEQNILREDTPSLTLSHEAGLKNAPSSDTAYFRVPQVKS